MLPQEVKTVLCTLEAAGHRAYAVGGCVRDTLRGVTPHDYDITTSARPEAVLALFDGFAIPTGLQHGTVTVRLDYEGSLYGVLSGSFYVEGHSVVCHITEGASPYDVTYEYRVDGRELYLTDDDGVAHYLRNS